MKVCLVTTQHEPQDDRIYFKECLSLAKKFSVVLIAPYDKREHNWHPNVAFCPIQRRKGVFGRLLSVIHATHAIFREKPNICHLHDLDLAVAIPFIRILTKTRIIYDSHEVFTRQDIKLRCHRHPVLGSCLAWCCEKVENWCVQFSHHIITAVAHDETALKGVQRPVTPIYNYPPLDLFAAKSDTTIRDNNGAITVTDLPVLYQGTISRERGLFNMIDAFAIVAQHEPRAKLVLLGMMDHSLDHEMKARVDKHGLGNNISYIGWLQHDQMAEYMKTCLVGLVPLTQNPKYNKALPIKLLEYMACGLPVIASNLPLVAQYINTSNSGLLYDASNTDELAHCILQLLADPELRTRMGTNGKMFVMNKWNWNIMETLLLNIYDQLSKQ